MTYEDAIKTLEVAIAEVEWEYPMEYAAALDMAIKALQAQQEAEKNEPLTLDERREMRYGWVWIISDDPDLTVSGWAYVSETGAITIWEYKPDSIVGNVQLEWEDYGKTWLAYRRPPKED